MLLNVNESDLEAIANARWRDKYVTKKNIAKGVLAFIVPMGLVIGLGWPWGVPGAVLLIIEYIWLVCIVGKGRKNELNMMQAELKRNKSEINWETNTKWMHF